MAVNYDDERFTEVTADKNDAIKESDTMYNDIIADSTKGYDDQIQASKDWVETQTDLQNKKTDFAIDEINQQKEQTRKDYLKEQSGAYVDWQKQSNQYGVNAEQMAATGMTGTGYSESSQVRMYTAYQNRVAVARESYTRAVLNYDNAIKEARLQNSSILAEIAYQGLSEQLKLGLEAMQYKNALLLEKAKAKREIDSEYYSRWRDVLSQINTENALAEQQRQFDANMAFQKEQFEWQKAQAAKSSSINKSSNSNKTSTKSTMQEGLQKVINKASNKVSNKAEPEVDMDSVLALGYGPISASKLNELVSSGKVVEYEKDGKLKYKKAFSGDDMKLGSFA